MTTRDDRREAAFDALIALTNPDWRGRDALTVIDTVLDAADHAEVDDVG